MISNLYCGLLVRWRMLVPNTNIRIRKDEYIGARISPDLKLRFTELCANLNLSISEALEQMVIRELEQAVIRLAQVDSK